MPRKPTSRRRCQSRKPKAESLPLSSAPSAVNESASDRAYRERGQAALKRQLNLKPGERLTAAEANAIARWERMSAAKRLAESDQRRTGEDLRAILGGIDRKQLVRLQQYGLPRNADGTYSLLLAVPWYIEHERARLAAEKPKGEEELKAERGARAQRIQIEVAEKLRQVHPLDHFRNWIWDFFHGVSARLQSWPRAVAQTREEELRLAEGMRKLLAGFEAELAGATGGRRPARKGKARR